MYKEGQIRSFGDIFLWIPKTVVAADIGKKLDRFTAQLQRPEDFTIKDLILIADLCSLTRTEILKLIDIEIAIRNKESTDSGTSS